MYLAYSWGSLSSLEVPTSLQGLGGAVWAHSPEFESMLAWKLKGLSMYTAVFTGRVGVITRGHGG